MAIAAGSRLGPYEIIAPLGAGGMGEVYRARDGRLRRDVALKILLSSVSADPGRRARFEQEAHAAAALNHPNILAVHDIGNENDIVYIATELVVGETLAAIIERGPLPVRTLLDIAVQLADGMASAHAAQIVHRDLKPANVMVTSDGRVKILDFGLAKQTARTPAADETIMVDQTEPGMIIGTVSYMSPEQARGKTADYRSDQFSLGLVLYEMATGKKAFGRDESVQTMAAIIAEEPAPLDARLPAPLRWVIDRCLSKEPGGRYESSRDLFQELRSLRDHLPELSTQVEKVAALSDPAKPARRRLWLPAAILAGIGLGAALTLLTLRVRSGPAIPDQSAYRFTPFSFESGGQNWPVWSPDGKMVAFAASRVESDPSQIFIRYLNAPTSMQLTQGVDSAFPVGWSPDSTRVLLMKGGKQPALWSIATVGGEPELFMTLPNELDNNQNPFSITISPDNKAVAAVLRSEKEGLQVVISSPPGSEAKKYLPNPFTATEIYNRPRMAFSPDGKQLLLIRNAGRGGEEAWLLPFPADGKRMPRRVLPNLRSYGGTPSFSWMPDSRRIVLSLQSSAEDGLRLWLADTESGDQQAITSGTAGTFSPAVAPDGNRMIVGQGAGNFDVISVELATATARTLIATERNEWMPAWAAHEPALVYVTDRSGPLQIWLHRANDTDRPIVTASDFPAGTQWFAGPALSPRADRVVYVRIEEGSRARLWISAVAGGAPIPLTNDTASEFPGSWSPDGAWFVYSTLRDGKINLVKAKTSGQATPVTLKENLPQGGVPVWSPAGDWIAIGGELISADGKTTRSLGDRLTPHYAFSQDGKSVYGLRSEQQRLLLFSIDITTGAERIIGDVGRDFQPASNLSPTIRLSLAPDGKSIIYASGKFATNLWLLEGIAPKPHPLGWMGFGR